MRTHSLLALAALVPLLSACGGAGTRVASAGTSAPPPRVAARTARVPPAARRAPPAAQVQTAPGLEGVIGLTATDLARRFGPPRLDVWEGDARKLQFSDTACILDVYLYPPAQGREPQATYVDARRASDGKDVDRAQCVAALRAASKG